MCGAYPVLGVTPGSKWKRDWNRDSGHTCGSRLPVEYLKSSLLLLLMSSSLPLAAEQMTPTTIRAVTTRRFILSSLLLLFIDCCWDFRGKGTTHTNMFELISVFDIKASHFTWQNKLRRRSSLNFLIFPTMETWIFLFKFGLMHQSRQRYFRHLSNGVVTQIYQKDSFLNLTVLLVSSEESHVRLCRPAKSDWGPSEQI